MDWLAPSKRKPSGYWKIKENVINESKNYKSVTEFQRKNSRAFDSAKLNGWLDEMDWLAKTNRKPVGYWKEKITYLRNLRNTTIEVIFVKDVILLILQLK